MSLSFKALLLVLATNYFILQAICHTAIPCSHDEQDHNPEFADVGEDLTSTHQEGRTLASNPNIRIYVYYDFVKQTAPSSYAAYIQNELLPPIISYFQSALKIKYPVSGNMKLGSSVSQICERNTPSILKTTGVEADYFHYIDTKSENNNNIALSKYCYLSTGTKRPIIARTMINRNMMPNANGDPIVHEQNMIVMMHEMMHTMGFSNYLYDYYLDQNGKILTGHVKRQTIAGKTRTILDLAPLTDRLRKYHGCSSLPGAILENNGGDSTAASHFEKKFYTFEAMSSGSFIGQKISEFSLALLEGTGWYVPDYSYADHYFFGQGQGCDFITGSCSSSTPQFSEFCSGNTRGCAANGQGGGYCSSDSNADGCKYNFPYEDYDCENPDAADYARLPDLQVFGRGKGSKCFTGDLNSRKSSNGATSFCFKYTCSGSGSSTQVTVQVGSDSVVCTKAEKKTLNGYYGSINCPDPLTFCSTVGKPNCPRNCMGRGDCVNNVCKCNKGFTGNDCALNA